MSDHVFQDQLVLLSSAVADSDNNIAASGRKLELVCAMELLAPSVSKETLTLVQKKVQDLCLQMMAQECPFLLVRPLVGLLSSVFAPHNVSGLHSLASHLLQVAAGDTGPESPISINPAAASSSSSSACSSKTSSFHKPTNSAIHQSIALQVAVGIARGPFLLPQIVSAVSHQLRNIPDPAARAAAVTSLAESIEAVGVSSDMWKAVIQKAVVSDKAPEVKVAGGRCLEIFLKRSMSIGSHFDSIQSVLVKLLLSPGSVLRDQHGLVGVVLVEIRHAYVAALTTLFEHHGGGFEGAKLTLIPLLRKHSKLSVSGIESLMTVLLKLALVGSSSSSSEENVRWLSITCIEEIGPNMSVSVATRVVRRLVQANQRSVSLGLRFFSECIFPKLTSGICSKSLLVALAATRETFAMLAGGLGAMDQEIVISRLVLLIGESSSELIALVGACLSEYLVHVPSNVFSLVNILLNHVTVQFAEVSAGCCENVSGLENYSEILALVIEKNCASNSVSSEMWDAIANTASALMGAPESEMIAHLRIRGCGCRLATATLVSVSIFPALMTMLTAWKSILGKKTKDEILKTKSMGVLQQPVVAALGSVRHYLGHSQCSLQPDARKIILLFLNNGWQLVQMCDDVKSETKTELLLAFAALEKADLASLAAPLLNYLCREITISHHNPHPTPSVLPASLVDLADPVLFSDWRFALETAVSTERQFARWDESIVDFFESCSSAGSFAEIEDAAISNSEFLDSCMHLLKTVLGSLDASSDSTSAIVDSCVAILLAGAATIFSSQPSSADFETMMLLHKSHNEPAVLHIKAGPIAAIAAFLKCVFEAVYTETSGASALNFFCSPNGMGALHPLARRMAASVVGALFSHVPNRAGIVQHIIEFSQSGVARHRAAASSAIACMLEMEPEAAAVVYAKIILGLGRKELSFPARIACLDAIRALKSASEDASIQKEIFRIIQGHALADSFVNGQVLVQLAGVGGSGIERELFVHANAKNFACNLSLFWKLPLQKLSLSSSVDVGQLVAAVDTGSSLAVDAIRRLSVLLNNFTQKNSSLPPLAWVVNLAEARPGVLDEIQVLAGIVVGRMAPAEAIRELLEVLKPQQKISQIAFASADDEDEEESNTTTVPTDTEVKHRAAAGGVTSRLVGLRLLGSILDRLSDFLGDETLALVLSAATDSNPQLAAEGLRLVSEIIERFATVVNTNSAEPVLRDCEAQLLVPLRKAIRLSAPLTQQLCAISCVERMALSHTTSNANYLVQLLCQPLQVSSSAVNEWGSYFALVAAANRTLTWVDKDLSLSLFARMQAVVSIAEQRDGIEQIVNWEYCLVRVLLDCGMVMKLADSMDPKSDLFSLTFADMIELETIVRSDVVKTVLRGLALVNQGSEGFTIRAPQDFPDTDKCVPDLSRIYFQLANEWLEKLGNAELADSCPVIEVLGMIMGDGNVVERFSDALTVAGQRDVRFLRFAQRIISRHSAFAERNVNLISRLLHAGIVVNVDVVARAMEIVQWLVRHEGGQTRDSVRVVVHSLLPTNAHVTVTQWKKISESSLEQGALESLTESMLHELKNDATNQHVAALAAPLLMRIANTNISEKAAKEIVHLLKRIGTKSPEITCAVLGRMVAVGAILEAVLASVVLPVCAHLHGDVSLAVIAGLVNEFTAYSESDKWILLVEYVLSLVKFFHANDKYPDILIRVLKPATVFKQVLATMTDEDRSNIESIIRKRLSTRHTESSTNPSSSVTAPQIQLKLNFGGK